jgi:hypothetical protein
LNDFIFKNRCIFKYNHSILIKKNSKKKKQMQVFLAKEHFI